MLKADHRFVFWIGVGLLTVALIYLVVGGSPAEPVFTLAQFTGSDGRLATCLLERTPVAATPLVFLACAVMAGCRPIYNLLQRWGWVK